MGFIREPDGIDFVIAPAEYTDADRAEVSAFFRKHKVMQTKNVKKPSLSGNCIAALHIR